MISHMHITHFPGTFSMPPSHNRPTLGWNSPGYECVWFSFFWFSDLSCLCCHNFSRLIQYVYVRVCLTFLWIVASSLVWTCQLLIMTNLTGMPQIAGSCQTPMHLGWISPCSYKVSVKISEWKDSHELNYLLGFMWIDSKMLYWLHRLMKNKVWGRQLKESKTSIYKKKTIKQKIQSSINVQQNEE